MVAIVTRQQLAGSGGRKGLAGLVLAGGHDDLQRKSGMFKHLSDCSLDIDGRVCRDVSCLPGGPRSPAFRQQFGRQQRCSLGRSRRLAATKRRVRAMQCWCRPHALHAPPQLAPCASQPCPAPAAKARLHRHLWPALVQRRHHVVKAAAHLYSKRNAQDTRTIGLVGRRRQIAEQQGAAAGHAPGTAGQGSTPHSTAQGSSVRGLLVQPGRTGRGRALSVQTPQSTGCPQAFRSSGRSLYPT